MFKYNIKNYKWGPIINIVEFFPFITRLYIYFHLYRRVSFTKMFFFLYAYLYEIINDKHKIICRHESPKRVYRYKYCRNC